MAFSINDVRKPLEGGNYIADRHLGVTKDGEVCEVGDPDCVRQIATPGYEMPAEEARAYGLLKETRRTRSESPSARQGLASPPEPSEDDEDDEESDLEGMTVAELREYAEENDIDLDGATRKDDIIAAIRLAEEADEDDED